MKWESKPERTNYQKFALFINTIYNEKLFFFLLFFVANVVPMIASDIEVGGIWYNFDNSTQTAEVTFRGADYDSFAGEYSGSIIVPKSITYNNEEFTIVSIGDYAFWNCPKLTSISLPETIKYLGANAFWNCSYLESVYIDDLAAWFSILGSGSDSSPLAVGIYVNTKLYVGGELLTDLVIPEGITNIRSEALRGCGSLESVIIPDGVKSIEWGAFYDCDNLSSAIIGSNVTKIESGVFYDCDNLTSIVIDSDNIKYDSRDNCNAIIETSLNSLVIGCKNSTIPDGIQRIEEFAFHYCLSLSSIVIPSSVTYIGQYAFGECINLNSIKCAAITPPALGSNVFDNVTKSIPLTVPEQSVDLYKATDQWNKFTNIHGFKPPQCLVSSGTCGENLTWKLTCDNILIIEGEGAMQNWATENDVPWQEYKSQIESISLSENVTKIGDFAFYEFSSIQSLDIPNNITSIGAHSVRYCTNLTTITIGTGLVNIGNWAFNGCYNLTSIHVDANNPHFHDITGVLFNNNYHLLVQYPIGLSDTDYKIPTDATTIGSGAFSYCKSLLSVTIPASVSDIESYAFFNCNNITSITCKAVTPPAVGYMAFMGIDQSIPVYVPLESVEQYQNDEQWQYFSNIQAIPTECTISYIDKDASIIYTEDIILHLPEPPAFTGFTFEKWTASSDNIADGITLHAIYIADSPTSAPQEVTNPSNPAQKLIHNGSVYILTDDSRTYTLTGQVIR